jgi:hypothetical protein
MRKLVGTFDDRETVKSIKEKLDADETLEAWILDGTKPTRCYRLLLADAQLRSYREE